MKLVGCIVFSFLALDVHATEVLYFQLNLASEILLPFNRDSIQSSIKGSDSIVQIEESQGQYRVRGVGVGDETLTFYQKNGEPILVRLKVVSVELAEPPLSVLPANSKGTRGRLGTRVGFRSRSHLFETLASQEEFFGFSLAEKNTVHQVDLRLIKPIANPEPKAARFADRLLYRFEKRNQFGFSLGDTDLFSSGMRSRGRIRGGRADAFLGDFHPYIVGGFSHVGVENVIIGNQTGRVLGMGSVWKKKQVYLEGALTSFDANPALGISRSGAEANLSARYFTGLLTDLSLHATLDSQGKKWLEGDISVGLPLVSLSLHAGHADENLEVYSSAYRFGPAFDEYGTSISLQPDNNRWSAYGSFGRSVSLSQLDEVEGKSNVESLSAGVALNPWDSYEASLSGHLFRSEFNPLSTGLPYFERGEMFEAVQEWEGWPKNRLTLRGRTSEIESSQLTTQYENQEASLGWKRLFSNGGDDYVHLEFGASHFHYPQDAGSDGWFMLGRVSSFWSRDWLKLDGTLQEEVRLTGLGDSHTFRAQMGATVLPNAQHELSASFFNQFEWVRKIYSNEKGIFFSYVFNFGSQVPSSPLFHSIRKHQVRGRVFIDANDSGTWDTGDTPFSSVALTLMEVGSGESRAALSDKEGVFVVEGVRSGDIVLNITRDSRMGMRLLNQNPRHLRVNQDTAVDFLFSTSGEIRGIVFNDVNGNGKLDTGDPVLPSSRVKFRLPHMDGWRTTDAPEGEFQIPQVSPGSIELRVDPESLPPGYRSDLLKTTQLILHPNETKELAFPCVAERGIVGRVFYDSNKNRQWDPGESGIDSVSVHFQGKRTQTGQGGHFLFRGLKPGRGRVRMKKAESEEIVLNDGPTQVLNVAVPVDLPR